MEAILSVRNLNKSFGRRKVLDNITFDAYAGEVFGFLGPNGAGKTTTIKIAVGHLSLDEGDVLIDGESIQKNFEKAMEKVGGIVENPELYKHMTGLQNLRQYARMRGVGHERIDEVTELVRMSHRINEKVRKYSLGMRQRLGVAQALLHKPKLLILDEPTNGLDPAGIKELRDILKRLAHEENISVMVSSHLMSEMELMCDRVGIIMNGRLVDVKTVPDLIASVQPPFVICRLKVSAAEDAFKLLDNLPPEDKSVSGEHILELKLPAAGAEELMGAVTEKLILGGVKLYSAVPLEQRRLEDAFIELTGSGGVQID